MVKPYKCPELPKCRYCGKTSIRLLAEVMGCSLCYHRKHEIETARNRAEPGTVLDVGFTEPITKPTTSPSPGLFSIDEERVVVEASGETEEAFFLFVRRESDGELFRLNYVKPTVESDLPRAEPWSKS